MSQLNSASLFASASRKYIVMTNEIHTKVLTWDKLWQFIWGLTGLNKVDCPLLLSSRTDRVTSSADWPLSAAPATPSWTPRATWQLRRSGGQRLLWIVWGHRWWLQSPWVAQMSDGLMKRHQESFQAAGKVCRHCSLCVNYIFVLLYFPFVCSMRKACLTQALPLPSIEWKRILWCHTTLWFTAIISHTVMPQRHLTIKICNCN